MINRKWRIPGFFKDIHESGIWFVLVVLVVLGIVVGVLDFIHWDREFAKGILAEANAVLIDIFLLGIVFAIYDYRRRRKEKIGDLQKELAHLRMWDTPVAILRKVELLDDLTTKGHRPVKLQYYNLRKAELKGCDLSGVNMRFTIFEGALMPSAKFVRSDLFCVDFGNSLLVQADLTEADLSEANFAGAQLSNAILTGADVRHADFRGAVELTCEQLTSAKNWEEAHRDPALACGAAIPQPAQKSLGQQFREQFRANGNPLYPYQLGTVIHQDGRRETVVLKEE
jgi:hypothetical protein